MLVCSASGATVGGCKSRPSCSRMLSAAGARSTWRVLVSARLPLQLPFTRLQASAAQLAPKSASAAGAAGATQGAAASPAVSQGAPHQDLLQSLSEEQLAAATTDSSRARVIAGPGSGKTRVIAARVLHLLQQQQVDPRQVLVITFTNKARGELVERLEAALHPATAKKLYISTFHGLAFDILRRNPALVQQLWSDQHKRLIGRPLAFPEQQDQKKVVKILNETEAKAIQSQILGGKQDKSTQDAAASSSSSEAGSSSAAGRVRTRALSSTSSSGSRSSRSLLSAAAVSTSDDEEEQWSGDEAKRAQKILEGLISKMKNFGTNVSKCTGKQLLVQMEEQGLRPFVNLNAGLRARLATQYDEYVLLLAREGLVDFDDLLCHAVHILQHHPELLGRWQRRYRHVLVDESQDTNSSQWELVKLLAGDTTHLFMVGDPHQGIYEFRGASPKHLSDSFKQWAGPQATTMWLKDNYRSRKAIVSSAMHMLHGRPAKDVQAKRMDKAGQASVEVVLAPNQQQEVQVICRALWQQHQAGRRWQDMTVLLRSNRQAEQLQEELVLNSIPCQLISGADLWSRAEVMLAIAAAQLVTTRGSHLPAVLRLVEKLPVCKGLNDARVQELQDAWWPVQLAGQASSSSTSSSSSSSSSPEPGAVQAITMCEALFEGCLAPGDQLPLDIARQVVEQQQGLTLSDLLPEQLRDEVQQVYKDKGMAFGEEWESYNKGSKGSTSSSSGSSKGSGSSSTSSSSAATSGGLPNSSPVFAANKAAAVAAAAAVQEKLEDLAPPWSPSHHEVAAFGKTKPRRAALQRLRGLLQLGAALAEVAPPAEALKVLLQVSGVLDWAAKEDLKAAKKGRPGRIRRLQHVLRLATRGNCYRVMPPDLQELSDEGEAGAAGGAIDRQAAAAVALALAGGPETPGLGSLQQFVAYASLMADNTDTESEAAKQEGDGRVQLMTLHASKGKEFPVVVIPHVVNGSLPSGRAETNSELQQERNLFYVGMTRAEDLLLVTAHTEVSSHWNGSQGPSDFLEPLLEAGKVPGVRVRVIED